MKYTAEEILEMQRVVRQTNTRTPVCQYTEICLGAGEEMVYKILCSKHIDLCRSFLTKRPIGVLK